MIVRWRDGSREDVLVVGDLASRAPSASSMIFWRSSAARRRSCICEDRVGLQLVDVEQLLQPVAGLVDGRASGG